MVSRFVTCDLVREAILRLASVGSPVRQSTTFCRRSIRRGERAPDRDAFPVGLALARICHGLAVARILVPRRPALGGAIWVRRSRNRSRAAAGRRRMALANTRDKLSHHRRNEPVVSTRPAPADRRARRRCGWESVRNVLIFHVRFFPQLGKKPRSINMENWTHAPQQIMSYWSARWGSLLPLDLNGNAVVIGGTGKNHQVATRGLVLTAH
jgi:hypothetical protein